MQRSICQVVPAPPPIRSPAHARGFTLVELMVTLKVRHITEVKLGTVQTSVSSVDALMMVGAGLELVPL